MNRKYSPISLVRNNRGSLSLFPFLAWVVILFGCSSEKPIGVDSVRRPNIIFIMTDDHTHDQMSSAGNDLIKTPGMDRLAREGVRFGNAFSTNSLCAPSRATILTGCYSAVNGIMGNSEGKDRVEALDTSLPTFPLLLQGVGYQTGIVGKWHLPHDPRGFDYSSILPGQGVYYDPEFIENGVRKQFKGYVTDIITDQALEYLDGVDHDKPFCLVYQHKGPHRPFTPAKRHEDLYQNIDFPYPETFYDDYSTRLIAGKAKDMRFDISVAGDYEDLPSGLSDLEKKKWVYQRFVKDHYRSVASIDEGISRVLDYLDEHDLARDTLVIYTTDNGFFLGEHGWYDKRFMYEPALRIPLLVRYPEEIEASAVEERMVMNVDIAPTILDYAGVTIPEVMQGESLRPLLEDEDIEWRKSIFYSYYENSWALRDASRSEMSDPSFNYFTAHRIGPHRGVRTDRFKLIEFYSKSDYWEFFDLKNDPHEVKNLYSNPAYASEITDLKVELRRLQTQYKDVGVWEQLTMPDYR